MATLAKPMMPMISSPQQLASSVLGQPKSAILALGTAVCTAHLVLLTGVSMFGAGTLLAKSPGLALLASLAGPELACLALGALTYVIFCGQHDLKAYWSSQNAKEKEFLLETDEQSTNGGSSAVEDEELVEEPEEEEEEEEGAIRRTFGAVLVETCLAALALVSLCGVAALVAKYPCVAALCFEHLGSLAGPELVMALLGAVTYILFSGKNCLTTYWSYYDALFPGQHGRITEQESDAQAELARIRAELHREKNAVSSSTKTTNTGSFIVVQEHKQQEQQEQLKQSILVDALSGGGGLDANAVAEVFLCLELRHVGRMAATCRKAKTGIWEDTSLWKSLGGPAFQHKQEEQSPAEVREKFRVWVYGLGGASWSSTFAETASTRHQKDVFEEASYILGGLQETDGAAEIDAFGLVLTEQLALLDAGEETATNAAVQLMQKAWTRRELLGKSRVEAMAKALAESKEYARKLAAHMEL